MADETRKDRTSDGPRDATPAASAPGAPRGAALSEGVASGPGHAGDAPGGAGAPDPGAARGSPGRDVIPDTSVAGGGADRGGRAAPPAEGSSTPRGADSPLSEGPRDHAGADEAPQGHAGGADAIDRAAAGETQEAGPGVHDPEGAAFPSPGGGAVMAPGGGGRDDAATDRPQGGEGAGDELRGGGGGPLPPGTGRPLPDPRPSSGRDKDRGSSRVAADPRVTSEERAFGRDAAALGDATARDGESLYAADGPTAREAGPEGDLPMGTQAQAMHALGVEAGRNGWVLWVMGIAAIVAGVIALALPPLVTSLAANAIVAAVLLASGAVGLVTSFRRRDGSAIAIGFALSALAVATGVLMLVAPLAGVVALGTLIVAYFLASGAARVWYGVKHAEMRGRGWLIASGVLSIVLAVLLWVAFPGAALWLPGVLLAVDLILYGTLMISLAVFGRPKLDAEAKA